MSLDTILRGNFGNQIDILHFFIFFFQFFFLAEYAIFLGASGFDVGIFFWVASAL